MRVAGCVCAEDEAALLIEAASSPARLAALVRRRVGGEPLEQVLGWASFAGLRVAVEPGVFVPRRRTEFLVRTAIDLASGRTTLTAVDLCAGTGALGAALVAGLPAVDVELHAADVDPVAVRCARRNVPPGAAVHQGDLFAALPAELHGRVDLLLANAPYVPTGELEFLPAEARDHEPSHTLDGGADGLDLHRRIAAGAPDWLSPDGHLVIEVSERQCTIVVAEFAAHGLQARVRTDDDLGATIVIGTPESSTTNGRSSRVSPAASDR